MTRINLERLLEKLREEEAKDSHCPGSACFRPTAEVSLLGESFRDDKTLPISDALLIFLVQRGFTRKQEYIKRVREIYRSYIKTGEKYSYTITSHSEDEAATLNLINLAKCTGDRALEEEIYRKRITHLTTNKPSVYGFLKAGNLARSVEKKAESKRFYKQAIGLSDSGRYFQGVRPNGFNVIIETAKGLYYGLHEKNPWLLRVVYNRILNELAREKRSRIAASNYCLDAEKDAREIGEPNLARYFHVKAKKYLAEYKVQNKV